MKKVFHCVLLFLYYVEWNVFSITLTWLSNNIQEFSSNTSSFIKPSPKPRGVVRSHTVAATYSSSSAKLSNNCSQNSSPDAKPRKVS